MRTENAHFLQLNIFDEVSVPPGNWYEERLALARRGKISIWCPRSCFDCRACMKAAQVRG